MFDKQGSVGGS